MPIFIRDTEADVLATEAVKRTSPREIERLAHERPLVERLGALWAEVDALGPRDPAFVMKAFSDEMWGDE